MSIVHSMVDCLLTCPRGIENLLAQELIQAQGQVIKEAQGYIIGRITEKGLYWLCLQSRLANRVILLLAEFDAIKDDQTLFEKVYQIPWSKHIDNNHSIKVDFHGHAPWLRHMTFAAQRVKDAIYAHFQSQQLLPPMVDLNNPQLRIYALLHHQHLIIGLDLSGESLHMRGYRQLSGVAPLKENLAAALLLRAGWPHEFTDELVLVDPMCGSGTLLIEAAQMAAAIPANGARLTFGFHYWRQYNAALWQMVLSESHLRQRQQEINLSMRLYGYDIDPNMIAATRLNAEKAGVAEWLILQCQPVAQLTAPPATRGLLITNPPYGERLGERQDLLPLYQQLNDQIKTYFINWRAALFNTNENFNQPLKLQAYKRYQLLNGTIACQLRLYEVFTPRKTTPPEKIKDILSTLVKSNKNTSVEMLVNRLRKNARRLTKWAQRLQIDCYRLYDADLPEFAFAIDRYHDFFVVQEYAPPPSIPAMVADERLKNALAILPTVLEVAADHIIVKQRHKQRRFQQYQRLQQSNHQLIIHEYPAQFIVNLQDYIDTGIYLDHRFLRRQLLALARHKRLLNLFCYTATATVQAALGGAISSVSVDASNTYIHWAKRNFALNQLDLAKHQLVKADVRQWLAQSPTMRFELIYIDPPTFSNRKASEVDFDIQRDHFELLSSAQQLLAADGMIYFSTHRRRFQFDERLSKLFHIENLTQRSVEPDFVRRSVIHQLFRLVPH